MLVTIVAVPLPDNSGLDVSRLEKVEDLNPEIAQKMLDVGTAREPSAEELAEYRKATKAKQDADAKTAAKPTAKPEPEAKPEPVDGGEPAEAQPKFDQGGTLPSGPAPVANDTGEPIPLTMPPASE